MPKPDDDRPLPEPPLVRAANSASRFPRRPANPNSELQPHSDPSATPDKVAGTTPAPADQERRIGLEKRRAGRIVS